MSSSSRVNHDEVSRYKAMMDRSRTRYQITEETEQSDGSVLVRVRKQYNDKADVSEYFNLTPNPPDGSQAGL